MTIMRLTGTAGRVHERHFDAKVDPTTGAVRDAFTMRAQDVDIAPLISTRVDLPQGENALTGAVDLAVEVSPQGRYLRVEIKGDWPKDESASRSRPSAVHAAS